MSAEKKVDFKYKLAAAAFAGVSGTSIVYPMDIVKTQLQSMPRSNNQSITNATISAFRNIITRDGAKGLYRGFSACMIGIIPEKGIKLAVNDAMRDFFFSQRDFKKIEIHEEIIAGSVAGFLQLSVTVPYEMVKIRLQLQGSLPASERKNAISIVKELGPFKLYRGLTATMARDVPFCVMFFPLYSNVKNILNSLASKNGVTSEPFHVGLLSGMIAGAFSGALVTPADMLKTRIQQGLSGDQTFIGFGREVVNKEGAAALFRGWHTRVLVIAPLYGFVSFAFELQKRWLMNH